MNEPIYFYPHSYLRDRQLDTIRNWNGVVLNPTLGDVKRTIVTEEDSLTDKPQKSWKSLIPLPNIKFRPVGIGSSTLLYIWGGIPFTGRFILEIDSPYALTRYNLRALKIYKPILLFMLSRKRCVEIRFMSNACRSTFIHYFGKKLLHKTVVSYPKLRDPLKQKKIITKNNSEIRFLYISTQFEIKGGRALIAAFKKAYKKNKNISLDIITFLPCDYEDQISKYDNIEVYKADLTRDKLLNVYVSRSDVLIHPTYAETFGLVVLEAMAYGLAVIATDVYAIKEMVLQNHNGYLLKPPISNWVGYLPSEYYYDLKNFKKNVNEIDDTEFTNTLANTILRVSNDEELLTNMKNNSRKLFKQHFSF